MRLGIVKASFASALDFYVYLHLNILRTLITIMKSEMKRRYVAGVLAMLLPIFTMYAQKDTTITTGTWKYTGEYPAGKGVLQSAKDGIIFGMFVNCKAEGYGIQYLPDGSRYQGNFENGQHSGNGRFYHVSGKIVLGGFKEGHAEGRDTLIAENGTIFIGKVRHGQPTKSGTRYPSASSAGVTVPAFREVKLNKKQKKFLNELKKNWSASSVTDRPARFQGGDVKKFYDEWMHDRLSWSKNMKGNEALVEYSFVVNEDGTISDVRIISSNRKEFSDAVIKVLEKAPAWEPAVKNGELVPQTIKHQIHFIQNW